MDNVFDVIVLGTGLSESIAAAAIAKAGLKVAHVDPNPYYGATEATLSLDELINWAESNSTADAQYRIDHLSSDRPGHQRQYSISLSPSVIPSVGPFISSLVQSGVARYGSYKLLGSIAIYRNGALQSVPQSKETIFQDRGISLIEKRRLMRFLTFASGEFENGPEYEGKENTAFDEFLRESFSLSEEMSQVIMFSLATCNFAGESTSTALRRVRTSLRSAGRYGPSSYLVGYYGGSGEITQGFCRAAAVNGGVYILGRKISNLVDLGASELERFSVELEDIPDALRSRCILSSATYVPRRLRSRVNRIVSDLATRRQVRAVARCITIVDGALSLSRLHETDDPSPIEGQSDSSLVVFPPASLDGGSPISCVTLLTAGAGTMSAPAGKNIIYLSMPLSIDGGSSKDLLHPYLSAILDLSPSCQSIFQLFYMQYVSVVSEDPGEDTLSRFFTLPSLQPDVFESVDHAAHDAENAFWSIIQAVDPQRVVDNNSSFWLDSAADDVDDPDVEY